MLSDDVKRWRGVKLFDSDKLRAPQLLPTWKAWVTAPKGKVWYCDGWRTINETKQVFS